MNAVEREVAIERRARFARLARFRPGVGALVRHQVGALAATVTDFGMMIACVRVLAVHPALATAAGALAGAVTNFTLARLWVFDARKANVPGQAVRYAMVSGGSLLLNVSGEGLAVDVLGVRHYVIARAFVAIGVSLLWNFPLHRRFVFDAAP